MSGEGNQDSTMRPRTRNEMLSESGRSFVPNYYVEGKVNRLIHLFPYGWYQFHLFIKSLPHCDHRMELLCSASPGEATCPEVCGMELDCSHICQLKCHKRSSHKDILCRQPCKRTCPEGHPCAKECFSKCDQCLVMVNKKLPCDHEVQFTSVSNGIFF